MQRHRSAGIQKISQAEKISELIFKILIRGGRGLAYIFNFNIAHFQIYYILKNGGGGQLYDNWFI